MVSDDSIIEWGFKAVVSITISMGAYLGKGVMNRLEKLEGGQTKYLEVVSEHKLHVSENYVKKDVIERIHSRIDEMGNNIGDIKTLIIGTLNKNP